MDEQKSDESRVKKPIVDPAKCIGCGLCVTTCMDVFELGDDGKAFVKDSSACANCNCQEAIDNCPAHAIGWITDENPKS